MYAGTTSGDVLQVSLSAQLFKQAGPAKHRVPKGVISVVVGPSGEVVIGGGDGSVSVLEPGTLRMLATTKLASGVTSCVAAPGAHKDGGFGMYCGTETCQLYYLKYSPVDGVLSELIQTCHGEAINDVAFPLGYSEVFATCGSSDVRVWHISEARELLRIQVPGSECLSVAFMPDGGSILSGWNDGKIRAFAPQSGRLLYVINDAHPHGVTCLLGSSDSARIISGGREGNVRAWRIGPESQTMLASMKEHKGPVNALALRGNDAECVSASSDGSCIVWDLKRYIRAGAMTGNTFFKACAYHPDESQIVTAGTDRKVTWWDAFDGQAIRVLDGSDSAEINALDISTNGELAVTGGGDKDVKVWGYDEGRCFGVGKGHSGVVNKVKFSPDGDKIVSVGAEGAIFIWRNVANEQ
jgi:WD40 repeat protein